MPYCPTEILGAKNCADIKKHLEAAKDLWKKQEELESYRKRYEKMLDLLNDEKRPGALFSLGLEGVQKLIESIVGPIGDHPYWVIHKEHFKILKSLVDATSAVQISAKQFDSALSTVKQVKIDSQNIVNRYATSGSFYKAFVDSFNPVILMAGMLRGMVDADVSGRKLSKETIKGWFDLGRENKKVHEAATAPIIEMMVLIGSLRLDRSAVDILVDSSARKLGKIEKASGYGKAASLNEQIRQVGESLDVGASSVSDLVVIIDSSIADVDNTLMKWISALASFEYDLYKMDVYSGFRNLAR